MRLSKKKRNWDLGSSEMDENDNDNDNEGETHGMAWHGIAWHSMGSSCQDRR